MQKKSVVSASIDFMRSVSPAYYHEGEWNVSYSDEQMREAYRAGYADAEKEAAMAAQKTGSDVTLNELGDRLARLAADMADVKTALLRVEGGVKAALAGPDKPEEAADTCAARLMVEVGIDPAKPGTDRTAYVLRDRSGNLYQV